MSPTIFREGPFRFYFFAREEARAHVHVQAPEGEAKFWISPRIELAANYGLDQRQIKAALNLVQAHEQQIRDAWQRHFGG